MNSSNPMTREELRELAALDAFGLLDEYEAALYTRSLHHAPAAVQDQILNLQAQIVSDESLLPSSENPDPALRDRVLYAVANAIERETADLEPLATIGRPHNAAPEAVIASVGASGQLWRAAVFALCAGLIVVAYFLAQVSSQNNQIAVIALMRNTDAQLEELIGPTFKEYIFDSTSKPVAFKSLVNAPKAPRAVMYIVEGSEKAFLVFEDLVPAPQPYTLSLKNADGVREAVMQFESTGKLSGMHVALNSVAHKLRNASWEISGPGGVVLASL